MSNLNDTAKAVRKQAPMLDRAKKPPKPRKRTPADTVSLFNEICRHPPLLPAPGGLSDFQFVVLATCLSLAWIEHLRDDEPAWRAGRKAIDACTKQLDNGDIDLEGTVDETIKWKGKQAYSKALQDRMCKHRPESVNIRITASALLEECRLAANGKNLAKLPDALDRLLEPIAVNGHRWDPLLLDWRKARNGKLRLTVDARWFPRKRFTKVPLPLPTNNHRARVLPLYLLIQVLNFSDNSNRIAFDELCRALGIITKRWSDAKQALDRAVEGLALFGRKIHHEFLNNGDVRFTDRSKREENIAAMREADAEADFAWEDEKPTEEDMKWARQAKAKFERECEEAKELKERIQRLACFRQRM